LARQRLYTDGVFEIGKSLREARVRRSIEFAQAEQVTKIRGKYLRALEDEQFEVLPSQTYVKGFLRTYAEYLGLDGQLYVDEYNSRFIAAEDAEFRPRRSAARPQDRNRRLETNVVLFALAAIAVVTIVVISAWSSSGKTPTAQGSARHVATAKTSKVAVPTISFRAVGGSSYAAIHRSGPSGAVVFAGTLTRGEREHFSGKSFWFTVTAPENLEIKVRGKTLHLPANEPSNITVTPTTWHTD
jgi:cytoskeletal protein RodZ